MTDDEIEKDSTNGSEPPTEPTRRDALRRAGRTALATAAVVGSVGLAGCADDEPPVDVAPDGEPADAPALVAHRGCGAEYPENTVAAVEASGAVADWIELDVRRCGTGELVAFHDETLDRVTNGSGRLDETPRERLATLDVQNSGEPVPTLAAALAAFPPDVGIILDLKERETAREALELAAEHAVTATVTTDRSAVVEDVQSADPTVTTLYGVRESLLARPLRPLVPGPSALPSPPRWLYPPQDVDGLIAEAVALECDGVSPRYELCLRTEFVARARDAGLYVFPWTVNSARTYRAVAATGVDGIMSGVCSDI